MPDKRWRLIVTRGLDGAANMALDESVARLAKFGQPPVLRLFDWEPWAISLGYHQSAGDVDLDRCRAEEIDVVRRPTGGRAILHAEEVTYSVIVPAGDRHYSKSVSATYKSVSSALGVGLKALGLSVDFVAARRPSADFHRRSGDVPCFASSARHELQVEGKKLVGSAQRHYPGAVLQHGSILIGPAHLHLAELTNGGEEEKERLRTLLEKRTTWLNQFARRPLSFDDVAEGIVNGFQEAYEVEFERSSFTSSESELAETLRCRFQIDGGKGDEANDVPRDLAELAAACAER